MSQLFLGIVKLFARLSDSEIRHALDFPETASSGEKSEIYSEIVAE
jgi:hypothetical protein